MKLLPGVACALGALSLAGCTTHHSGAPGAPAVSQAADAGTVRQMLPTEPTSLDPAAVPDVVTEELLQHTFEGLTRFNDHDTIEPCLAEAWEISADGKSYTFHIRKHVKFHNGREMTAADVKYSWERALSPATKSAQAADYLEGILGLKDVSAGKRPDLTGVTVIDPYTLKVDLDHPRAYFTGMLTMPQDYIVCKEAVAQTKGIVTDKSYVGTGPFKFEAYSPGHLISLAAFSDYWGGKPACTRIEMPVILNPQTAYDNFVTDKLDIYPGVPELKYAQDQERHALTSEYVVAKNAAFVYIGLQQVRQPLFKNADIRRALALAIDRDQIVKVAYKGVRKVATGILPDGMPLTGPLPPQFKYDPPAARALLTKAGFAGGKGFPPLNLTYIQQNPQTEAEAVIVKRNLHDNLGIEITLSSREATEFFNAEQKHMNEMWIGGWVADYLDPQDFLSTLFVTGKPLNFFDYSNRQFDTLCEQADSNLDEDKRAELYGKAHSILINDMPMIPVAFGPRISLVHNYIKGWRQCSLYTLENSHTSRN